MPTISEDDDILKGLRKLFAREAKKKNGPAALKMNEICRKLKLIDPDEAVTSGMSAKVRGRIQRLVDAGLVTVEGNRASTTYTATV